MILYDVFLDLYCTVRVGYVNQEQIGLSDYLSCQSSPNVPVTYLKLSQTWFIMAIFHVLDIADHH